MAGRLRGRQSRKASGMSSSYQVTATNQPPTITSLLTELKNVKNIAEEPLFNLGGRSSEEIYRLTLLDSANLKRSITRRLSQLNHLVRLRRTAGSFEDHGMSFGTFLRFICVGVCDGCKEIRGAALRAIRHHTISQRHCHQIHLAHLDFYIARALDVSLDNEIERIQAILLVRKMMRLGSVATSVVNAVVAIAAGGGEERERMTRICLETLCELVIYCPEHVNIVSALRVLMEFLLESNCVPLTTAVVAALSHFSARAENHIPAKFCDITQILHPVTGFEGIEEKSRQDTRITKTVMAQAAKIAIVAALRTWEGLHLLTHSNTGIRSLIGVLFLSNQLAQEAVLDIVTLLLYLPGDWESSTRSVCDSWSLQENFVADEARALLPHIGRTRLNLCSNYLALLLFVFHQNGLIDGLVHVITAEGPFHRRAFHILNAYLALANIYLPSEFTSPMQSLPSLISLATNMSKLNSRLQSADTVTGLLQSNSKPDSSGTASVYLQHVLQMTSPNPNTDRPVSDHLGKNLQEGGSILRDTLGSMTNNEYTAWDWHSISSLLKSKTIHRDDPVGFKFLHRLLFFYKPSNKLFASVLKKHELATCYTVCGCLFVQTCLLEAPDLLEELLTDLHSCLAVVKETPNGDVIFNPLKLFSSCVADYFIFVGRISSYVSGEDLLVKKKIFALFMDFITEPDIHESYIKLIVTTLDYTKNENGIERALFEKVITSCSPALRCYATLHLRTLLRARMLGFSRWAMDLLISLTNDLNIVVARTAVEIIDEACDEKANLDVLVQAHPSLQHLSPTAEFLTARILGTVQAFNNSPELVKLELVKWRTSFNRRYVTTVEQLLNSKLLASDFSDGIFSRQSSTQSEKFLPELFLPEHLYGQLVRHIDGCDLVRAEMPDLIEAIKEASSVPALDVKAALWALGHAGRTVDGMALLNEFEALDLVVDLVANHENVSVRGTAFFVIGLWSTTERGADLLKSRDWLAIRHDRHEAWPLVDQRVQYTWEDSSAWMSSHTLGQSNTSNVSKPARILCYTTLPSAEARPQSPGMVISENGFEMPASVAQHKSSRGESGFESSDGGLLDSAMMAVDGGLGDEFRHVRSESAKTQSSELSNGSVGSVIDRDQNALTEFSVSSQKYANLVVEERTKKRTVPLLMRSKSGFHGSVDEMVSRPRRSESRLSFREMKNSLKQVVLKRHSHHISPIPVSVTPQVWSNVSRAGWGEASAREEKFLGICLPVRRSVWSRHPAHKLTSSALLQKDVPCLHGQKTPGSSQSKNGLEIHTKDNCLVCLVAGQDLSLLEADSSIVDQRRELIHLVSKLATPLGHKAAEQGLLQLKNQYAECFMDPCLYTEVSHLLASFTYKLSIRRLIQELFFDVPIQKVLRTFLQAELMQSEASLDMKIVEGESHE